MTYTHSSLSYFHICNYKLTLSHSHSYNKYIYLYPFCSHFLTPLLPSLLNLFMFPPFFFFFFIILFLTFIQTLSPVCDSLLSCAWLVFELTFISFLLSLFSLSLSLSFSICFFLSQQFWVLPLPLDFIFLLKQSRGAQLTGC